MSKAVPFLKPDLVLIGVVQGDDLSQLYENHYGFNNSKKDNANHKAPKNIKQILKAYLTASFGNILSLVKNQKPKTFDIKTKWEKDSKNLMKSFTRLMKIRFYTLDTNVQNLFKSGDLNPALVNYYINFPDMNAIFNNPRHPATVFSAYEMDKDLESMKSVCRDNDCSLIFINLPLNDFTGHKVIRTPSDILNPFFEQNNKIDSIYRSLASTNKLPYIELTKHFISLSDKDNYYFLYDGHPNENGYREIANYVGKQLIDQHLIHVK